MRFNVCRLKSNFLIFDRQKLQRGNGSIGRLISDKDFKYIINQKEYRDLTYHVDPYMEVLKFLPHLWVGGTMSLSSMSPFDPVYFLHHAFIDYMWSIQRRVAYRRHGPENYKYPLVNDEEAYGVGQVQDPFAAVPSIVMKPGDSPHYPPKHLFPFQLKNEEAFELDYSDIYTYKSEPRCFKKRPNCKSPYLFCIPDIWKCAPKLTGGAKCSQFADADPCYKGTCNRITGKCVSVTDEDRFGQQFVMFLFSIYNQ